MTQFFNSWLTAGLFSQVFSVVVLVFCVFSVVMTIKVTSGVKKRLLKEQEYNEKFKKEIESWNYGKKYLNTKLKNMKDKFLKNAEEGLDVVPDINTFWMDVIEIVDDYEVSPDSELIDEDTRLADLQDHRIREDQINKGQRPV